MSPVLESIIHTVAFYDAVGSVPLTKGELYKHLIYAPGPPDAARLRVSFAAFLHTLDEEWGSLAPYISSHRGFYFLNKNKDAYTRRISIGKTGIKKWRIAQRMIGVISLVPYVRLIAVTGSLALNATHRESDIDILIVAKNGHIWTTRMFVGLLTHILGKRRHGRRIRDRICLNHYMADSSLTLRPPSLFSAHIYSSFVPVWSASSTDRALLAENAGWTSKHLAHFEAGKVYRRTIAPGLGGLRVFRLMFEHMFPKRAAKALESFLKKIQVHKIARNNPLQQAAGEGVLLDDTALVFHHPRPQNQEALYLYRENLRGLGLA